LSYFPPPTTIEGNYSDWKLILSKEDTIGGVASMVVNNSGVLLLCSSTSTPYNRYMLDAESASPEFVDVGVGVEYPLPDQRVSAGGRYMVEIESGVAVHRLLIVKDGVMVKAVEPDDSGSDYFEPASVSPNGRYIVSAYRDSGYVYYVRVFRAV